MSRGTKTAIVLFFLIFLPKPSLAQEFNGENLKTAPPGSGEFVSVETTKTLKAGETAYGLFIDWTKNSLVVVDIASSRVAEVISSRVLSEIGFSHGFGRFDVGAILPLILYQSGAGDPVTGIPGVNRGGVGDLRLFGRLRLLGNGESGFGLASSLIWDRKLTSAAIVATGPLHRQSPAIPPEGCWRSALNAPELWPHQHASRACRAYIPFVQ